MARCHCDRVHTAACQLQTFVERVDARIFRGDAQRASSSISMPRARDTPFISAASASTPDPVPTSRTAAGGSICIASSSASRHSVVVGCSPVPNAAESTRLDLVQPRCAPELSEGFSRTRDLGSGRVGVSRPVAEEIETLSTPRALTICSGATLSGIRAAMPPSNEASSIEAPSSTRPIERLVADVAKVLGTARSSVTTRSFNVDPQYVGGVDARRAAGGDDAGEQTHAHHQHRVGDDDRDFYRRQRALAETEVPRR